MQPNQRAVIVAPAAPETRSHGAAGGTRSEIQALRAVAVLGVLIYHLWPTHLPGGFVGVDVFFVVSGFLITDHLLREHARSGRISLPSFWARRARRLLPASLLVLVATAAGVWLWVPDTRWAQFGGEIIASALYVENWALALQSVDYMALSNAKSPVQHFWSLGVEEQFYLLWPLLIVAGYTLARRFRADSVTVVAVALTVVIVGSLVHSTTLTAAAPTVAYFATSTRAWEFGAGGLLAVAAAKGYRTLPPSLGAAASWVGFAVIALTMFVFDGHTPFPSFTAALPVVATLLVILGGAFPIRWAPTRLFSVKPVQFIGDVSYGTYLWHWPIIVLAPYALNSANGLFVSLGIAGLSVLLGWASKVVVEDPVRERSYLAGTRPRRSFLATGGAMASVVLIALPLSAYTIAPPPVIADNQRGDCYGAEAMHVGACAPVDAIPLVAPVSSFALDLPPEEILACEMPATAGDYRRCEFGNRGGDASKPHLALLGDSHATRWVETLTSVVDAAGGHLSTFLVSGCASVTREVTGSAWGFDPAYAEQCRSTSERMIEEIAVDPDIDIVVLTNRTRLYVTAEEAFHPLTGEMVADTIGILRAAGKHVIVLEDPPEMNAIPAQGGGSAPDCLLHASSPIECALPRAEAEFADPLRAGAAAAGAEILSIDDLFCDEDHCMSRIGGVVVYSDDNHLTRSYAASLESALSQRLDLR